LRCPTLSGPRLEGSNEIELSTRPNRPGFAFDRSKRGRQRRVGTNPRSTSRSTSRRTGADIEPEAAYFCEIMRAGIQSIPRGQVYSAYALGLTYGQSMRLVILPQAFRNMIPILLTQTIILFQDTSLVYVISATDFVGAASKIAQRDSRLVEMYLFVAAAYFVLCYTLSYMVKLLQKKVAVIR
jgi:ABC-type spermidine/putrescine transport system permease subunit II